MCEYSWEVLFDLACLPWYTVTYACVGIVQAVQALQVLIVAFTHLLNALEFCVGELLTVAPWAARVMPGLFSLNERAILFGHWKHGLFTMTAVGAFNVGSIQLALDKVHIRM